MPVGHSSCKPGEYLETYMPCKFPGAFKKVIGYSPNLSTWTNGHGAMSGTNFKKNQKSKTL